MTIQLRSSANLAHISILTSISVYALY